jgi:nucleotide-binding universal stress UspA family protein
LKIPVREDLPLVVKNKKEFLMKAKILLALDGSEPSIKAARYVANLLGNQPEVAVTVFHVHSPHLPSLMDVEGYENLSEPPQEELEEAKALAESQIFAPTREMLEQAGFSQTHIHTEFAVGHDVAHEILEVCKAGNYDTVVMGKRGLSRIRTFLTGSVTEKVVRHASGRTVWVVE